jgi:hypothetical protein
MRNALVGLLIIAAAVAVYQYVKSDQSSERFTDPLAALSGDDDSNDFRCEGKTRCSEMHSCEEATFYLRNCPGTKMDGDGDGVPCESQWCGE